jgi:hypothetical protein
MSARELNAGEGVWGEATCSLGIATNKAITAHIRVYPLLMINGVYRMSFAMGLAVYALPQLAPSISRHRARMRIRSAQHAFRRRFTETGADIGPREQDPLRPAASGRPGTRQGRQE